MIWRLTESTIRPLDIDTTSSKCYIYFRRDVSEKKYISEFGTTTIYQYMEAKVGKTEYEKNKSLYDAELSIMDIEQAITELDLRNIETEQAITDLDLRIMEVESR